jgi:hypothetical protein
MPWRNGHGRAQGGFRSTFRRALELDRVEAVTAYSETAAACESHPRLRASVSMTASNAGAVNAVSSRSWHITKAAPELWSCRDGWLIGANISRQARRARFQIVRAHCRAYLLRWGIQGKPHIKKPAGINRQRVPASRRTARRCARSSLSFASHRCASARKLTRWLHSRDRARTEASAATIREAPRRCSNRRFNADGTGRPPAVDPALAFLGGGGGATPGFIKLFVNERSGKPDSNISHLAIITLLRIRDTCNLTP